MSEEVTIVIPVFNALEDTIACVSSLLQSDAGSCRIIVNDDGSPLEVSRTLQENFGAFPNVEIHSNFRNRGYTANIQFGVDAAATPYVAIINSDTIFPKVWLAKLLGQLRLNPCLAAVGPLSNAASYQSIPDLKAENGEFSSNPDFGASAAQREAINGFLETAFGTLIEDMPILNGFCTLFRRDMLVRAGGFNAQAFPTGYGEENDLCMRLMAAGHRLGVALDTFVYHAKSKSFGSEKKKEYSRKGREALEKLYGTGFVPDYASVLDRNTALGAVRFTVSAMGLDMQVPGRAMPGPGESLRLEPDSRDRRMIVLNGPVSAAVWPDLIETYDTRGQPEIHLTIGSAYVLADIPAGCSVRFAAANPVETLLGVCALQSHYQDITLVMRPAITRSEAVSKAMRNLDFRYAYIAAGTELPDAA